MSTYIAGALKFSNKICNSGVRILLLHQLDICLVSCTHELGRIRKNIYPYLGYFFSVCLWVQRRFCQQDCVFFKCYMKRFVQGEVPNVYHVVPVGHNTMLNGILTTVTIEI